MKRKHTQSGDEDVEIERIHIDLTDSDVEFDHECVDLTSVEDDSHPRPTKRLKLNVGPKSASEDDSQLPATKRLKLNIGPEPVSEIIDNAIREYANDEPEKARKAKALSTVP